MASQARGNLPSGKGPLYVCQRLLGRFSLLCRVRVRGSGLLGRRSDSTGQALFTFRAKYPGRVLERDSIIHESVYYVAKRLGGRLTLIIDDDAISRLRNGSSVSQDVSHLFRLGSDRGHIAVIGSLSQDDINRLVTLQSLIREGTLKIGSNDVLRGKVLVVVTTVSGTYTTVIGVNGSGFSLLTHRFERVEDVDAKGLATTITTVATYRRAYYNGDRDHDADTLRRATTKGRVRSRGWGPPRYFENLSPLTFSSFQTWNGPLF